MSTGTCITEILSNLRDIKLTADFTLQQLIDKELLLLPNEVFEYSELAKKNLNTPSSDLYDEEKDTWLVGQSENYRLMFIKEGLGTTWVEGQEYYTVVAEEIGGGGYKGHQT